MEIILLPAVNCKINWCDVDPNNSEGTTADVGISGLISLDRSILTPTLHLVK